MSKAEEVLYSNIPPTRLRNKNEKFRKAKNSRFWGLIADLFFYNMLENRFYSLRMKGAENCKKKNGNYACILYAPHSNWWDGIVGYNLMRRVFHSRVRMIIEELNRFPILSKVGAFPVNKKSPQSSMKALKYSVEVLSEPDIALWIFPQGIIRPPLYRPIEFQTGITYIAQKAVKEYGGVNLFPISINYSFLRENKPEILVDIGEPIILEDANINRKEFTRHLEKEFEEFCDEQLERIRKGDISGYEFLFEQELAWYRKIEKRLKRIDIKNSGV